MNGRSLEVPIEGLILIRDRGSRSGARGLAGRRRADASRDPGMLVRLVDFLFARGGRRSRPCSSSSRLPSSARLSRVRYSGSPVTMRTFDLFSLDRINGVDDHRSLHDAPVVGHGADERDRRRVSAGVRKRTTTDCPGLAIGVAWRTSGKSGIQSRCMAFGSERSASTASPTFSRDPEAQTTRLCFIVSGLSRLQLDRRARGNAIGSHGRTSFGPGRC